MCLNPKSIHRQGRYLENNYRGKKGDDYDVYVMSKCGHCAECVNEKANNWVIRNHYEMQEHKKACFITLTYKDNPKFLIKKHLQDFIKRLRRHLEYRKINDKLRYFACAEYGTLRGRPHMHIIIYNWKESWDKLLYKGINKKHNVIYESETIKKVWKYGLTSYQMFEEHEIPYITLYDTPKEQNKKAYIMQKDKAKRYLTELKEKKQSNVHRKYIIRLLEEELKKIESTKEKYIMVKEFNTWSLGLGWKKFQEQYTNNYTFTEYIEDKEFITPSPWVKKLANLGNENAIKEMLRRESELTANLTAEEYKSLHRVNYSHKHGNDIIKWQKKLEFMEEL